jgi:predicted AlkP superfamily phosphohydrolase/phosphomutase
LLQTTEPTTGEPVVVRVWRREELYAGPFYEMVPDLVFALRPDFTASPVQQGLWTPTGWASGDHSLEGMFIAWGRAIAPGRVEGAALIDIAPTALYLLDQPVPFEMDGRVLLDALDAGFVAAHPVRRGAEQATYPVEGPPQAVALTAEEEADVAARLRGLGYL